MAERILIIDDDLDTLRLVGLLLERQGYKILAADNGSKGMSKARSDQPDLILLDVMMPDLDGFEVAQQLREHPDTAEIPIVFFTAKTQVDDKVAGFEAGADDYLTKPVHPKELTARVSAILARSGKGRVAVAEPEAPKGKVIGVLAARGGLGVTTMALNLGITMMSDTGEEVIVAELRPGQGTIGLDLGIPPTDGLTQLLKLNASEITMSEVEELIVTHSSGIRLLLASYQPSDAQFSLALRQYERIVRHLSAISQYTVLDLGSGLSPLAEKVIDLCDHIVVVVEPEPNVVTHTKAMLDDLSLRVLGLDRIQVAVVSRLRSELKMTRNQIQDQLGHIVGYVFTPVPEVAFQAASAKVPLILFRAGSSNTQQLNNLQQFKSLAQAIHKHGQKIKI